MSLSTDKQERKERPIATGVFDYFPDALAEVAHVSFVGNQQHNPGQPLHWSKHKSTDHADCIARHMMERGMIDNDGLRHSAKVAWRALAMLQIELEAEVDLDPASHEVAVNGCAMEGPAPTPDLSKYNGIWYCPVWQNDRSDRELDFVVILDGESNWYRKDGKSMHYLGITYEAEQIRTGAWVPYVSQNELMALDLVKLGCPKDIAEKITSGTRFTKRTDVPARWVYIAGPMRGRPNFNFQAFDRCRDRLLAQGYNVINPADMGRSEALLRNPLKEDGDMQLVYAIRDFWSLAFIRSRETKTSDADYQKDSPVEGSIALLDGWARSTGATAEFFVSRWFGLNVLEEDGQKHHDPHPEYISHYD